MKLNRLWLPLAAAFTFVGAAQAADLGGNCCADLEERVAELEATTARRGNRKVSVTLYGHVSKSLLSVSGADYQGVRDNPNSPSRVGVRGDAKISSDLSAGYLIELGVGNATLNVVDSVIGDAASSTTSPSIRHAAVWLESKRIGRLTMGHTSDATDGIGQISLANTTVIALMNTGLDGSRRDVIRYDTPSIGGFVLTASLANGKYDTMDYGLSARYVTEFGGMRLAAGAGIAKLGNAGNTPDKTTYLGSLSVMHIQTGLFANAATGDDNAAGSKMRYHLQGGIERNWFGVGATTLYGEYAKSGTGSVLGNVWGLNFAVSGDNPATTIVEPNVYAKLTPTSYWGLGMVQTFDAAALDLYVGLRRIEIKDTSGDAHGTAALAGVRIKF
jgi:hypothetical protein